MDDPRDLVPQAKDDTRCGPAPVAPGRLDGPLRLRLRRAATGRRVRETFADPIYPDA